MESAVDNFTPPHSLIWHLPMTGRSNNASLAKLNPVQRACKPINIAS